jgi:uncharacterized protein YuzE
MQNRLFIPYQSFGELHFRDNYISVREKLNSPFSSQFIDDTKRLMYDFFDDLGLRIEYDKDGNLLGIEVFNDNGLDFIFMNQNLSIMGFRDIEMLLQSEGDTVQQFSIGIYSPKFGLSICGEEMEGDEDNRASSFSLVRKDYMSFSS